MIFGFLDLDDRFVEKFINKLIDDKVAIVKDKNNDGKLYKVYDYDYGEMFIDWCVNTQSFDAYDNWIGKFDEYNYELDYKKLSKNSNLYNDKMLKNEIKKWITSTMELNLMEYYNLKQRENESVTKQQNLDVEFNNNEKIKLVGEKIGEKFAVQLKNTIEKGDDYKNNEIMMIAVSPLKITDSQKEHNVDFAYNVRWGVKNDYNGKPMFRTCTFYLNEKKFEEEFKTFEKLNKYNRTFLVNDKDDYGYVDTNKFLEDNKERFRWKAENYESAKSVNKNKKNELER